MTNEVPVSANRQNALDCYAEVKRMYPLYSERARDIITGYLEKHDRRRLRIFLGDACDLDSITGLSYVRLGLQESMLHICLLLKDEEEGNHVMSPLLKDVFVRYYLDLPYKVIQGGNPPQESKG